MRARFLFPSLAFASLVCTVCAQSPAPVVVQAAPGSMAPTPAPAAGVPNPASLQAAVKALLELKAANAEILKKQEATLLQLDELGKAAEQIKVYTKRG